MDQIVECVPNFSEGRDGDVIRTLAEVVKSVPGVWLLDQHMDHDHHRSVLTFAGIPQAVAEAAFQVTRLAVERIDLRHHHGAHPRVGATDVVPFIPIKGSTMAECASLAFDVGRRIGSELHVPVFLYEQAARHPNRKNLEAIRKGGLKDLAERVARDPTWVPDFGPPQLHPTAGATVVGARPPLIAFNVNLQTNDLSIAQAIARKIRFSNGGLPCLKAIGVDVASRGLVQVSMNLMDFERTPLKVAFDAVQQEAGQHGVRIAESELIGLVPAQALMQVSPRVLLLKGLCRSQTLETRLEEAMSSPRITGGVS